MPTQKMISTIRDQINKMDLKSGLVVPFYVRAETYGTEGQVLNTADKVITRTETLRAYGQGRNKFYNQVGVRRVVWVTVGDERTCPECEPLEGQEFPIDKTPPLPYHAQCRCCLMAARAKVCRAGVPVN